jgi:hypothetical protein
MVDPQGLWFWSSYELYAANAVQRNIFIAHITQIHPNEKSESITDRL